MKKIIVSAFCVALLGCANAPDKVNIQEVMDGVLSDMDIDWSDGNLPDNDLLSDAPTTTSDEEESNDDATEPAGDAG